VNLLSVLLYIWFGVLVILVHHKHRYFVSFWLSFDMKFNLQNLKIRWSMAT
jgi:hypothetical protein